MIMLETLKVISAAAIGGALGGLIGYVSMYKAWRLDKEDFFDKALKKEREGKTPPTPPKRPTGLTAANMAGGAWFPSYDPPSETGFYRAIVMHRQHGKPDIYKMRCLDYSTREGWGQPEEGKLMVQLWQPLDDDKPVPPEGRNT